MARREERLRTLASEIGERHDVRVKVLVADLASEAGLQQVENWKKSGVDSLKHIEEVMLAEFPLGVFKDVDHIDYTRLRC